MKNRKKIGIALSGGGYRAAAYHIGTFRALNRLGILNKIDVISSVSGGSITAAYYALNKDNYEQFEQTLIEKLQKSVLKLSIINLIAVLLLIIVFVGVLGWWALLPIFSLLFFFNYQLLPFSFWIERAYNKLFFDNAKLSNLPKKPNLAINSTDVVTGTLFTFSRLKMTGYTYKNIIFKNENFPVARAVMASSCVPFAFSPVKINKRYYETLYHEIDKKPLLVDGGLYDNQGAYKLGERNSSYHTQLIIASDAGTSEINAKYAFNILFMLKKTADIMMRRIRTFQLKSNVFSSYYKDEMRYAYVALLWDVSERPITSFINNIKEGNIAPDLFDFHNIKEQDIIDLKSKDKVICNIVSQKLIEQLKHNIKWQWLEKFMPTKEEHDIAKAVGTNLTALKNKQINALIKHSNWLTEVQIRLYLPHLITKGIE